ncbi:MAG: S49 family peptidase [Alphaproteobacteria bacterium]|nr:S49 family peptidase [Alphaproteobacteria bacterium]
MPMSLSELFTRAPVVPVLRFDGVIGAGMRPGPKGLALKDLAGPIERAFSWRGARAVALAINSPGGAPVQTALIAGRIRQWAKEKNMPVFAFVEDVAASGGYWLALAADEIWADASSVVGSIGVVAAGFGLQDMIAKLGIERRVHAQGERKAMLDPFRAEKPDEVARLDRLMAEIHETFKAEVRARRAGKLKVAEAELFEGDVWTGRRAVELGLVDGLGDVRTVLRGRFGDKVKLPVIQRHKGWLRGRLGLAADPAGQAEALLAALEERLAWARYGL